MTDSFRQFQYLTSPFHLSVADARQVLEQAGWFTDPAVRL